MFRRFFEPYAHRAVAGWVPLAGWVASGGLKVGEIGAAVRNRCGGGSRHRSGSARAVPCLRSRTIGLVNLSQNLGRLGASWGGCRVVSRPGCEATGCGKLSSGCGD